MKQSPKTLDNYYTYCLLLCIQFFHFISHVSVSSFKIVQVLAISEPNVLFWLFAYFFFLNKLKDYLHTYLICNTLNNIIPINFLISPEMGKSELKVIFIVIICNCTYPVVHLLQWWYILSKMNKIDRKKKTIHFNSSNNDVSACDMKWFCILIINSHSVHWGRVA